MTSTLNKQSKPIGPGRGKWLGLAIIALVVGGLAIGLIYFFGGAEPAEVDLASTVSAVNAAPETTAAVTTAAEGTATETTGPETTGPGTTGPETTGATGANSNDVSGVWTVDTTVGTFNFEEATATFAGFRVEEELARVGRTTAVGRSPDVSGSVTINGTSITDASIEVDLTAIVSDESRREKAIREALNTAQNPASTFVLTEPIDFGEVPAEGITVAATATGDLTINGVTRTVEIPLEAQVSGEAILIVGSANVVFADYDIRTPSAPIVLSVADEGTIELQLWLVRA